MTTAVEGAAVLGFIALFAILFVSPVVVALCLKRLGIIDKDEL